MSVNPVKHRVSAIIHRYNSLKGSLLSMNQLMADLERELIRLDSDVNNINIIVEPEKS